MLGPQHAAGPSGRSNFVDLTDDVSDTDPELQQAMEASLLETYSPNLKDELSPEMCAQQQEMLLFYARQRLVPEVAVQDRSDTDLRSHSHFIQQPQPSKWHSGVSSNVVSPAGQPAMSVMPEEEACSAFSQEYSDQSTSSAEASLSAQQLSGKAAAPILETPVAAEMRMPVFGSLQTEQEPPLRLATWPTAASQLMTAAPSKQQLTPPSHGPQAPSVSPASRGSAGSLSNKRQRLGTWDAPSGLFLASTAQQSGDGPIQRASSLTTCEQQDFSSLDAARGPSLESDADTDAAIAGSNDRSEGSDNSSSAPRLRRSLNATLDQQLSTQHQTGLDGEVPTETAEDAAGACSLPGVSSRQFADVDGQSDGQLFQAIGDLGNGNGESAWQPYQLIGSKGKGIVGPSPAPSYLPEQPSKLDHTKPGSWVWWKVDDATWMLVRVQRRFRDWAGLLESFQVLLADAGNLDVPVEVPTEQVCMHFFPGSRVNIQGQPAQQGEVLPIQYAPFHGIYNVRLDDGSVLLATHYDMSLLQNYAEASSWASSMAGVSQRPAGDASHPEAEAQQQRQSQCSTEQRAQQLGDDPMPAPCQLQFCQRPGRGPDTLTGLKQDAVPLAKPTAFSSACPDLSPLLEIAKAMTQPASAAAAPSEAAAQTTAAHGEMLDKQSDDDHEEEEPQAACLTRRRRTKQSVAQRMAPKRRCATPVERRSVRRKLAHAGHAEPAELVESEPSAAIATEVKRPHELQSDGAAVSAEDLVASAGPAGQPASHLMRSHVTPAAQKRQLNPWDHESDEDLFVDLSGCNIVPKGSAQKQKVTQAAAADYQADCKQSVQTGRTEGVAGTDSAAASTPVAFARKRAASEVMLPQLRSNSSGKRKRLSGKGTKAAQDQGDGIDF